jgi:acyl-coenzyme A synthetase/AMP-(fatty) acid ligase
MEDEQGRMRPSHDHAYLEIVDADARGVGDLVVTTLTHEYMPLLRYRIGDLVSRGTGGYVVHGRRRDALQDARGRRLTTWDVDQCFAGLEGILHYELRQGVDGRCGLRFLPDNSKPTPRELEALAVRLQSLLGASAPADVVGVDLLPPTSSGKFRLTLGAEGQADSERNAADRQACRLS